MKKADIIQRLLRLNFDKSEYWVVTGGAMVLHGIREETGDLDLGCTAKLAGELERRGCSTVRMEDGARKIVLEPDVELFENWLYDRVDRIEDIPVISLEGLIAMKKALGRAKDFLDIQKIEAFQSAK